jgi:hypothetical protein
VLPAGTVILAGTETLLLLSVRLTVKPPVGAAAVNCTTQFVDPGEFTLVGEQIKLFSATVGDVIVIVPEVPEVARPVPEALEAAMPLSATGTLPAAPAAMVNLTAATCPFAIDVAFNPYATQMVELLPLEQVTLLPAAVAAAPGVTEMLVIAVAG